MDLPDDWAQLRVPVVFPPKRDSSGKTNVGLRDFRAGRIHSELWTHAFSIIVPTSEVVLSDVVLDDPNRVLWISSPPEGYAVHFDILLSAPGAAASSDGRGFATAEGYEQASHLVGAFDLPNSERVWVVSHAEPVTREQSAMREELRSNLIVASHDRLREALSDDEPHDLRAIGIGVLSDSTRFYLDLAISKEMARGEYIH